MIERQTPDRNTRFVAAQPVPPVDPVAAEHNDDAHQKLQMAVEIWHFGNPAVTRRGLILTRMRQQIVINGREVKLEQTGTTTERRPRGGTTRRAVRPLALKPPLAEILGFSVL